MNENRKKFKMNKIKIGKVQRKRLKKNQNLARKNENHEKQKKLENRIKLKR